ncbi:glutaredoxin-like NrdH family protein [Yersinia rohdei]|uniref:Glutaredoxin-like protein NrdH n=1 Tax=Yersinia rohdei TaxID=29485 RepID=A0A0U1HTS0_YERRO|nr:glutaredoxin-like protein NrdH [Yersinia rohdei]AJJ11658.1 glutaredoxin-like NrdH family protein [Yersinia rohdei]EEQ03620.1 Glutaredoxin-related protein NrdH [Yersinia rohdei ATCC 43380]MDN0096747.1 glutaredoxin-like protein NrdH [Yersinia rohdei]OWF77063.1 NrdH-redoxin [Yersinia rohdei]CNE92660.1 glutaredoxin-like protein [Yersinia rohdei]
MSIIIYSKPDCVQCNATYRALDRQGIAYQVIDLTLDEAALNHVKTLGYQQVPVIIAGEDHWSGFRPDKINALVQAVSAC